MYHFYGVIRGAMHHFYGSSLGRTSLNLVGNTQKRLEELSDALGMLVDSARTSDELLVSYDVLHGEDLRLALQQSAIPKDLRLVAVNKDQVVEITHGVGAIYDLVIYLTSIMVSRDVHPGLGVLLQRRNRLSNLDPRLPKEGGFDPPWRAVVRSSGIFQEVDKLLEEALSLPHHDPKFGEAFDMIATRLSWILGSAQVTKADRRYAIAVIRAMENDIEGVPDHENALVRLRNLYDE